MTYLDSVRYLYALGNEIKTAKFGLERIRIVCSALGDPQRTFRIVHVAGTNGKGSTCAMIEAGLRVAGVRTGLFTSPHLIEPTERIRVAGIPVSAAAFLNAFNQVHETAERLLAEGSIDYHPTYFETVTAMAFLIFRDERIHTAVIEVGLGGRLDATNIVEPAVAVITPIDYDHEAYLGNTLESIAAEKAGILKAGATAVFARQPPECEAVLEKRARDLGLRVRRTSEFQILDLKIDADGSHFSGLHCPLAGEHQVENAMAAALALESLGVPANGIGAAHWPGRLQRLREHPDLVVDGAHNPSAARALARYIARFYSGRRLWLIYGTMRDKAVEEIAGILFPLADELILTAPDNPRALRPEVLAPLAPRARISPSISGALTLAESAAPDDVVVVTGSLFVVGEALDKLVHVATE
jgi:dihydrofolate synthase/folylpolyglutamate synthase